MPSEVDYLKLARTRGYRPSTKKTPRKIMVYSRNKKGKTWFSVSAGIGNTLVLDPEHGTDLMKDLDPFVWPIEKWQDLQEAYGALRTGKLTPNHLVQGESSTPFDWVSCDGLTRMNNMALKYVMKVQEERDLDRQPGMVAQRDYGKSGELMKQMLLNFHSLPINVCYTSQEKMITATGSFDDDEDIEDDPEAYFVPDLPNAVRGAVNSMAEVIGRLYTVRVDRKGTKVMQRRLQIGLHEKYDTGFRSDFDLPDVLKNPTIPKLIQLMTEGGA